MNSHPQSRSTSAGFTLVELLTVIAIIAILMGLLFPAINIARNQARKAQARSDCSQISGAVKAYYTEYGKYPLGVNVVNPPNGDFLFGQQQGVSAGSGVSNFQLFDILRNIDSTGATQPGQPNQYNPRAIVFFDGKTATDSNNPRAGFVPTNYSGGGTMKVGAFIDPWGCEYFVAIDADYDSQLDGNQNAPRALPYADFAYPNNPKTGVGVFSVGQDQKLGTNGDGYYKNQTTNLASDDIISWQ